jgi:hypothetical protein
VRKYRLGVRAAYIAMIVLLLATAGVAAAFLLDLPWLEPAQAVPDRKGDVAPRPLRSNTEIKADRLAARPPDPAPELGPASLTLDTARQFMAAPVTGASKAPPPKPTNALLDDKQIAAIKARLKLSPAQEKLWPPVERALREVVAVAYAGRRPASTIDPQHDSVKRLLTAAGPFLAQLRAEQKEQIQTLMRVAGLGTELPRAN